MTTLTTTGFGDVAPVSSIARAAVMLEQFVGVLYVALVISRLAGFCRRPEVDGPRALCGLRTFAPPVSLLTCSRLKASVSDALTRPDAGRSSAASAESGAPFGRRRQRQLR
jgi:hypothetical protein